MTQGGSAGLLQPKRGTGFGKKEGHETCMRSGYVAEHCCRSLTWSQWAQAGDMGISGADRMWLPFQALKVECCSALSEQDDIVKRDLWQLKLHRSAASPVVASKSLHQIRMLACVGTFKGEANLQWEGWRGEKQKDAQAFVLDLTSQLKGKGWWYGDGGGVWGKLPRCAKLWQDRRKYSAKCVRLSAFLDSF